MQTNGIVEQRHLTVLGKPARVFSGGRGDTTVLLLHGGWEGAAMHWSRSWDLLGQHAQVIAPDLPGIGDVNQPGRASLSEYVDWLDALLTALDVGQVLCVGNSFGASLAWSFAGRHPERCTGVVLVDGAPMPRTPAPLRWLSTFSLGRGLMALAVKKLSFTPRSLRRAFADPTRAPDGLMATLGHTPQVQLDTFVNCMIAGDGPPAPQAPVLVVWGEQDHLPGTSLASGKKLVEKLTGANAYFIADAGHFPQVEHPHMFVRAIERFAHLSRLG